MGSKGRKPRKPSHSQHLPKVGTKQENERLLHEERKAVVNQMGVGSSSPVVKTTVTVIVALIVIAAVFSLVFILLR